MRGDPLNTATVTAAAMAMAALIQQFTLVRNPDGVPTVVALLVQFPDGTTVARWLGETSSTVVWASLADAWQVHGHPGTQLISADGELVLGRA